MNGCFVSVALALSVTEASSLGVLFFTNEACLLHFLLLIPSLLHHAKLKECTSDYFLYLVFVIFSFFVVDSVVPQ